MIPNSETSVIAAIGELNSRGEANAHTPADKNQNDLRIDFYSRGVHRCTNTLYNIPDEPQVKPWPPNVIIGEDTFNAKIGPTGGSRGYSKITGKNENDYTKVKKYSTKTNV